MGQSFSGAFKIADQQSSGPAMAASGVRNTVKTPASSGRSRPHKKETIGDAMAAIQSTNAFFDSSLSVPKPLSQSNDRRRQQMDGVLGRQADQQAVDAPGDRTTSRPVPVKGARWRQQPSYQEHIGLWRDHDDSDSHYLKRLYELRTWDMWVRITEARKHQRTGTCGTGVRGEGPPLLPMDTRQDQTAPAGTPATMSLDDDMIFSCDLE